MANNSLNWMENSVMNSSSASRRSREVSPSGFVTPPTLSGSEAPAVPMNQQGPPPVTDRYYIPGYLASIIGKIVRAEFVVGNSQYLDKTGRLVEVGVNYFVLDDLLSKTKVMCDLYSVKFVTVFPE